MGITDEKLQQAIAALPLRERQAFTLQSEGRSIKEIAETLRITRWTAHRLVTNARQKIQGALKTGARSAGRRRSGRSGRSQRDVTDEFQRALDSDQDRDAGDDDDDYAKPDNGPLNRHDGAV